MFLRLTIPVTLCAKCQRHCFYMNFYSANLHSVLKIVFREIVRDKLRILVSLSLILMRFWRLERCSVSSKTKGSGDNRE